MVEEDFVCQKLLLLQVQVKVLVLRFQNAWLKMVLKSGYWTMTLKLLKKQCDQNHGENTVIIVTHNALMADIADEVIYVKNGRIENIHKNASPKAIEEVAW